MTLTFDITPELLWFLAGIIIMLSELLLPGFIIIFFGLGAWVTALAVLLGIGGGFNIQLIICLVSSLFLLFLFRKKGQRYFKGKVTGKLGPDESIDDVRGQRVVVKAAIHPNEIGGKVEFHGTLWEAVSEVPMDAGSVAEIVERSNLTLKVRPLPTTE
jgi:inner membrane protein